MSMLAGQIRPGDIARLPPRTENKYRSNKVAEGTASVLEAAQRRNHFEAATDAATLLPGGPHTPSPYRLTGYRSQAPN